MSQYEQKAEFYDMTPSLKRFGLMWLSICILWCLSGCGTKEIRVVRHQMVENIPCKKFEIGNNNKLKWCELSREAVIQGHHFPAKTKIDFDDDGNLDCCFLGQDSELEGHLYRGKGQGYQTCFHPNGNLRFGNLVKSEVIQGINCEKSNFWIWTFKGNSGINFYENGKLKSCLLASDLNIQDHLFRKGNRIFLDHNGWITEKKANPATLSYSRTMMEIIISSTRATTQRANRGTCQYWKSNGKTAGHLCPGYR